MRVLRSILLGASILVPFSIVGILGIIAFNFLVDNYPGFLMIGFSIFGILLVFYCLGSSILGGVQEATEDDVREEVISEMQDPNNGIVEKVAEDRNKKLDIKTYHEFKSLLSRENWKGHLGFNSTNIEYKKYLEESCKYWEEKYNL